MSSFSISDGSISHSTFQSIAATKNLGGKIFWNSKPARRACCGLIKPIWFKQPVCTFNNVVHFFLFGDRARSIFHSIVRSIQGRRIFFLLSSNFSFFCSLSDLSWQRSQIRCILSRRKSFRYFDMKFKYRRNCRTVFLPFHIPNFDFMLFKTRSLETYFLSYFAKCSRYANPTATLTGNA